MQLQELAEGFLDYIDPRGTQPLSVKVPGASDLSTQLINRDQVTYIAEHLMDFLAEVVAQLIGVGSEREAVTENEDLFEELRRELRGWSNDPINTRPKGS